MLLRDSAVAEFADFAEAWQAAAEAHPATYADFAAADLLHYHTALRDWSDSNRKTKYDWLATIRGSMRRDADAGKLRCLGGASLTPTASSHAPGTHPFPTQRPANGAKPDGQTAAQLTRALLARQRQQPG